MMSTRLRIAVPALALALWAGQVAAAPPPAPRAAPVWTVDTPASRLSFRAVVADKPVDGVFKRWDAQLAFDPAQLAASRLQVVVETGSVLTGDPARDALLPSAAGLGAARFPRATFASRTFAPDGPGAYRVSGMLTLHGVSHPVDAQVRIAAAHDHLTLTGGFTFDRRAFGVGAAGSGDASGTVQMQVRLAAKRAR